MTQPISDRNRGNFTEDHYILQVNRMIVELSGAVAVPIYYDMNDTDLYPLLNKVNGVWFTGGGLTLVDRVTGE